MARCGRLKNQCTCTHVHILADHVTFVNKLATEIHLVISQGLPREDARIGSLSSVSNRG